MRCKLYVLLKLTIKVEMQIYADRIEWDWIYPAGKYEYMLLKLKMEIEMQLE